MFLAFKGIAGIVPGWAWALICAASLCWGGFNAIQASVARSGEKVAKAERDAFSAELETTRRKVDENKSRAAKLLAQAINDNLDAEAKLATALADREKSDAQYKTTVQTYRNQVLAAAGVTGRLRDPNAEAGGCGRGGGGAAAQAVAGAAGGAGDGAERAGLLSKELTEFLLAQAYEADRVNIAYKSCKADAIAIREQDSQAR